MLNCKDASRLQSARHDRGLSASEHIGLKLHLLICKGCRGFAQQLQLIRLACRRIDKSKGARANGPGLSPEARARVLKELASERGEHS